MLSYLWNTSKEWENITHPSSSTWLCHSSLLLDQEIHMEQNNPLVCAKCKGMWHLCYVPYKTSINLVYVKVVVFLNKPEPNNSNILHMVLHILWQSNGHFCAMHLFTDTMLTSMEHLPNLHGIFVHWTCIFFTVTFGWYASSLRVQTCCYRCYC